MYRSKIKRMLSLFLSLVFILQLLPVHALAAEIDLSSEEGGNIPLAEIDDSPVDRNSASVVAEIPSERSEYQKEFILDNGLRLAVVYPIAVHYEEDGEWREIDNTLRLVASAQSSLSAASSGDSAVFYQNTAGLWDVKLPATLTTGSAVEVSKDGYTLNFSFIGELNSNSQIMAADNVALATSGPNDDSAEVYSVMQVTPSNGTVLDLTNLTDDVEIQYPETEINNIYSAVVYPNAYSNTDIRYDLSSHKLKESIIIQEASASLVGYQYVLNAPGLSLELQENNAIYAYASDAENGTDPVFYMPAPYLLDEQRAYSEDVDITLQQNGDEYTLTYYLPRQWMLAEERAYPVVLDPIIQPVGDMATIRDQTVFSEITRSYLWGCLAVGHSADTGKARALIKFNSIPDLSSADVIVGATMSVVKYADSTQGSVMEAHEVYREWESESVRWSDVDQSGTEWNANVEDHQIIRNAGRYYWDITNIAQQWYATGKNTGVLFRLSDGKEATDDETLVEFYASDWGGSVKPTLQLLYINNCGLEEHWDYTSHSAGRAGTGHINCYTGNLVWVNEGLSFSGNRMPVSISLVYNANDKSTNSYGIGYGWRTNFNQRVRPWSNDDTYYYWQDQDGTRQYFKYDSTKGKYINELDNTLTLTDTGSGNKTYCITDKQGNKSYFDTEGRLRTIQNNQETKSEITITYLPDTVKINTITDGAGRKYLFNYENNLLQTISYQGTGNTDISVMGYQHTSSNLIKITYPDKKTVSFGYGSNHLLTSATDISGYQITYGYNTSSATRPNRVSTVTESDIGADGTRITGGTLTIGYSHNLTTFTDHNDNKETMQFNKYGSTVSVQDGLGRAQFAQYGKDDNIKSASQVALSSKLQNTVVNLVRNGGFEEDAFWTTASGNASTNSWAYSSISYLGGKSISITCPADNSNCSVASTTSYSLSVGKTYTLSAYVKTTGMDNGGSGAKLVLRRSDGTLAAESSTLTANSNWTRLEVTYEPDAAESVTVLLMNGSSGTAYFDCVQLELSATASRYNLVDNGDFRYAGSASTAAYGWTNGTACTATDKRSSVAAPSASPQMDTYAYTIIGGSTENKRVYQNIPVSGSKGDTFTFSGWSRGDAGAQYGNRKYGLILRFYYTDGTTSEDKFFVAFNPDLNNTSAWQYIASHAVAEKAYSSLRIILVFDISRNAVRFDGIQLFKEEFGQSYTYDSNGNIKSTTDLQKQKTTYEYTSNNLTKMVLPSGAEQTYTYDSHHNVLTATSPEGVVSTFTYDTYGNNTSVTVSNSGKTLSSSAVYTNSDNYDGSSAQYGNQLVSTTDPLGKTTTYGYNADTGVLDWVQAPGETKATRTNYTYDKDLYRTTGVTKDGSTVGYTYANDLLNTITSASGTVYDFAYGDFDLVQSVGIGTRDESGNVTRNRTLISHEYSDNADRYLTKSTYGNEDFISYAYDSLGRAKSKTYEDGDKISYAYDNSGNLAQVKDSASGRTTRYYYDFLDRIGRVEERGGTYSNVTKYTYNAQGLLSKSVQSIQPLTAYTDDYTTTYAYDTDNRPTSVTQGGGKYLLHYDGLGRMDQTSVKEEGTVVLTTTIGYTGTSSAASTQVASWSNSVGDSYTYTYDDRGNITSISDGTNTTRYTYDALDQLIREDNQAAGKTWTYSYSNGGNIIAKTEYAHTTDTLGTAIDSIAYTYDETWKDLLATYDGQALDYDTIGNLTDDGTWVYTWEHGRQLAGMSKSGTTISYTYNADGLRSTKQVGDTVYQYYYDPSGQLTDVLWGSNKLHFVYDSLGPVAVTYNGVRHYYLRNAQGDITGIMTRDKEQVVSYTYDAWGNVLSVTGTMADTLGAANPLRYRGYVYDQETGLYYVSSRYYNPEIGRWINADNQIAGVGGEVLGYNMFAYCMNNPVNMSDPSGNWPKWATKLVAAVAVVAVVAVVAAVTVATAGAGTAIAAVAVGGAKGAAIGFAVGAATGAAGGAISHRISTGSWNGAGEAALNGMANGALSGAVSGAITGGITGGLSYNSGATSAGKGFDTYRQLKNEIGSPGAGNEWHHIVEQSQIAKSGFSPQMIQNTNNIMSISKTTHRAISGYYSSVQPFTNGMIVRNWLAGQSFSAQYEFGINVIKMFM